MLAEKLLRQRAASKAASDEQKMILEQQLDRLSGIANHGAEDLQHPCSALHPFLSGGVAPPLEGRTETPAQEGKQPAEPWLGSPSATPRKKVGRAKKEKSGTVRGLQKGLRSVSSAYGRCACSSSTTSPSLRSPTTRPLYAALAPDAAPR